MKIKIMIKKKEAMDKYAVNFIKVDIKRHGTDGTDENFLSKNYYH